MRQVNKNYIDCCTECRDSRADVFNHHSHGCAAKYYQYKAVLAGTIDYDRPQADLKKKQVEQKKGDE